MMNRKSITDILYCNFKSATDILEYQLKVQVFINQLRSVDESLGNSLDEVLSEKGDLIDVALDLLNVPPDETIDDIYGYCRDNHYSWWSTLANDRTIISDDNIKVSVKSYIKSVWKEDNKGVINEKE